MNTPRALQQFRNSETIQQLINKDITPRTANNLFADEVTKKLKADSEENRKHFFDRTKSRDRSYDTLDHRETRYFAKGVIERYIKLDEPSHLRKDNVIVVLYFLGIDSGSWNEYFREWHSWVKEKNKIERAKIELDSQDKLTYSIDDKWLYYFIRADGRIHRAQINILGKTDNKGLDISYLGTNNKIFTGTSHIDDNARLVVRLVNQKKVYGSESTKEANIIFMRFKIDRYIAPTDEIILVGTRSFDRIDGHYSNIAILRRLKKMTKVNNYEDGVMLKYTSDKVENTICTFLSNSNSFKIENSLNATNIERAKIALLKEKGRKHDPNIKAVFEDNKNWVSLSLSDDEMDNITITHWQIELKELEQKIEIRQQEEDPFLGEITTRSSSRLWLDLYSTELRKTFFGKKVELVKQRVGFLLFGTAMNDSVWGQKDSVAREILLPANLLPEKFQSLKCTVIPYLNFKDEINLHKRIKLYLIDRENSRLSFPYKEDETSLYKRQWAATSYNGNYLVYGLNKYSKSNPGLDLFRFTLQIDSLGKSTLRKCYENGSSVKYEGLAQITNRTLNIPFKHMEDDSDDLEFRQNAVLYLIVNMEDKSPNLLIGQLADTDVKFFPDCSACFVIRVDALKELAFVSGRVDYMATSAKNSEYELVENFLKQNFDENIAKNIGLEKEGLTSIKHFFDLVGGVYFRNSDSYSQLI